MANSTGHRLRLSPGEIEEALREEKKKWRIFRLQQVREQARIEAGRVRGTVHRKKKEMVCNLEKEMIQKWQENKENDVHRLQQEYDGCFKAFGQAHEQAKEQPDAVEMLAENMAINRQKAARRGCEATKVHREQNTEKEREKHKHHHRRKSAIRKEKLRATRVSHLPTPKAFKKDKIVVPQPVPKVQLYEHGTLTTTNYVPKKVVIEKEIISTRPTAHQLAEVEEKAHRSARETKQNEAEDIERKREERGKAALHKERLHRMYRDMLEQLDRAQKDHHLSAFIKGVDCGINETEESRLKTLASCQHEMEMAVESVLRDKRVLRPMEESESVVDVPEEMSDLKEVSDDFRSEAASDRKGNGLIELQDEIRKHRLLVNQVISDLHDASLREREPEVEHIVETDKPEPCKDDGTPLLPKLSSGSQSLSQIGTRTDELSPAYHVEPRDKDSHWKEEHHRRIPPPIVPPRNIRIRNQNDDIHLKETVPAHLMPDIRTYARKTEEDSDDLFRTSTSERTVQPESSDDIEVKIHFSSDSSMSQSPTPPDNYGGHRVTEHTRPFKDHPRDLYHGGDSSTEYLSLPSSFSLDGRRRAHLHNLEMIQQRRQNIQRLLDGKGHEKHKEMVSPVTYMQGMTPEGSGRKLLSRKSKFELKKRELLHHYVKKLLDLRDDELMQISASTVEGSGLTVGSLSTLLESLNKNDDDSIFSSLVNLTESSSSGLASSAIYPDIDQVPTKLSSSPEFVMNPNLPFNIPRIQPHHSDESFIKGCQETYSGSISYLPIQSHMGYTTHGIHESESSSSCPEIHFPPLSFQTHHSAPPNLHLSTDESSSAATPPTSNDSKFEDANLQRELKILHDLKMLQRLKQELLMKKNSLLKEGEGDESPSYLNDVTTADATPLEENKSRSTSLRQKYRSTEPTSLQGLENAIGDWRSSLYQSGKSKVLERNIASSHISAEHRPKTHSCADGERDSDDSEDNFMFLKPVPSLGSTLASSGPNLLKDGPRKTFGGTSLIGTNFKPLMPEGTLGSEIVSGTRELSLLPTGGAISSSKLVKAVESKSSTGTATSYGDVHLPVREIISTQHDVIDESLVSRDESTSSSDMPRESSNNQTTMSNQNENSGEVTSRPSSSNSKSDRSSGTSITSIPDMAEILQRFGLDWAKSMIRKMDRTEEHSSSGN